MSGLLGVASVAAQFVGDLFIKKRAIGILIPDVTIDESLRDDMVITSHPVEYGTPISDHAYRMPYEVTARYGWDNSPIPSMSSVIGAISSGSLPTISLSKIKDTYTALLKIKDDRVPFTLYTGKRNYDNMLIASLNVTTDARTENALMVSVVFREVLIVHLSTASVQADASQQAAAQKTADTTDKGSVTTAPASQTGPGGLQGHV